MALHVRTVTEAITLAVAIQTPLQTDLTLTAAERAQIGENLNRLTALQTDVNPNTQFVPPNRRTGHVSALRDRVSATVIISDKYWATQPEIMYDALDLMFDIASAVEAAVPTIESDLSHARP